MQVPDLHVPPVHAVPSGASGLEQPVVGSQVPAVWQSSAAVHVTLVPAQAPAVHVLADVHLSPSSQLAPSGMAGLVHTPVVVSHIPTAWHASHRAVCR